MTRYLELLLLCFWLSIVLLQDKNLKPNDVIRLLSKLTNKYLRVQNDGDIDCIGVNSELSGLNDDQCKLKYLIFVTCSIITELLISLI